MKTTRPPFPSFPTLKNQRIILREVHESDLQNLIEISFYDGILAKDLIDAQTMNERIRKDYISGTCIHWTICSVVSDEVLGTCGFYRGFRDDIGEIGYVLRKAHQGKGYMADAMSLMLDFGWIELGLKAIKGVTSRENQSSINVLRKAGFKITETVDDKIIFLISYPDSLSEM